MSKVDRCCLPGCIREISEEARSYYLVDENFIPINKTNNTFVLDISLKDIKETYNIQSFTNLKFCSTLCRAMFKEKLPSELTIARPNNVRERKEQEVKINKKEST